MRSGPAASPGMKAPEPCDHDGTASCVLCIILSLEMAEVANGEHIAVRRSRRWSGEIAPFA